MLKWLTGSDEDSTTQNPSDALTVPTPPPASVSTPTARVGVNFVPANELTRPQALTQTISPTVEQPDRVSVDVTESAPLSSSTTDTTFSETTQPIEEKVFGAVSPTPSTQNSAASPSPEVQPTSQPGVIEVQEGLLSDLMSEAFEDNSTQPSQNSDSQQVAAAATPTPNSQEQTPRFTVDTNEQSNSSEPIPDLDFPDISSEIRKLMEERWMDVAKREIAQNTQRQGEINSELDEVADAERKLAERRRSLETEMSILTRQHGQWTNKLKGAESVLEKVVNEINAV